jgi:hypothetical protein
MGLDITGVGAIAEAASKIVDKFFPDKTELEKAKASLELQAVMNEFELSKAQAEINLEEVKNPNWFVAGWRPFTGWICGVGLLYAVFFEPIMRFIATMEGYKGAFPIIDTSITLQVLLGMLGLGAMRSFEKHKDVEHKR